MYANRYKRVFLAGLVIAMVLAGATFGAAQVPECTLGQLSDYQRLDAQGCTIGDERFFNFTYQQVPGGIPATAISITPGTVPGNDEPALLFEAAWVTPAADLSISYTVEVAPRGKPISGASLEMQFGEITGTGEVRIASELHPSTNASSTCGPAQLALNVLLGAGQSKRPTDSGQLKDPARRLCVVSPVSIRPGKNGSASLRSFMTVFHTGPSPSASASIHPVLSAGVGQ
jgi:hypothetical protein